MKRNGCKDFGLQKRRAFFQLTMSTLTVMAILVAGAVASINPSVAAAASATVTISPPAPEYTSAEFSGTVDPGTQEVEVAFEYREVGQSSFVEAYVGSLSANAGPTPVTKTLEVGRLRSSTEYEARLDAYVFGQNGREDFYSPLPNPTFETKYLPPPSVSIEAPTAVTARTAHFTGHLNPNAPGGEPAASAVTWSFDCKPGCQGNLSGSITESLTSDHLVEGEAVGLEPGTSYEVTLHAANSDPGPGVETAGLGFTTADAAPDIGEETAGSITLSEATLAAKIATNGASTSYRFQYLPEVAYISEGWASQSLRSSPPGVLEVATGLQMISARVSGLLAGTRYVWRALAENPVGLGEGAVQSFATQLSPVAAAGSCPNEIFRVGFASSLPDCRAYEQVSPVQKNGNAAGGRPDQLFVAEDGSSATFYSNQGTDIAGEPGGEEGTQDNPTYLASRGPEQWSTQRLLPPTRFGRRAEFLDLTPDAHYAFVEATRPREPGASESGTGLFSIDTRTRTVTQVVPYGANPSVPGGAGLGRPYAIDGTSADGSIVFFETEARLTSGAAEGADNLYVWNRSTGSVSLAGVMPASTEAPSGGSYGGSYAWWPEAANGSTAVGGALDRYAVAALHAISPEGNQVYFTAAATGQLYLRRGIVDGHPNTVEVSRPNPAVSDGYAEELAENGFPPLPAAFQEATPDGKYAFFLSRQALTADATTGPFDEGLDLYRWDAGTERLTDIAPDPESPSGNGAELVALLGASADGSSGIFVAKGVLPVKGSVPGTGPQAGSFNVYRFSEQLGKISYEFVTILEGFGAERNWSPVYPINNEIQNRTSRWDPQSEVLLYRSVPTEVEGRQQYAQIYRYSPVDGSVCVSCNPTGQSSVGPATLQNPEGILPSVNEATGLVTVTFSQNLSSNGDVLFFESPDSLVAGDTNGSAGCKPYNVESPQNNYRDCQDVYEWEAPETPGGSCRQPQVNGGCLYLLSTGQSSQASFFVGASKSGDNAFIATTSRLVPADADEAFDVYDARVDGGLAAQFSSTAEPCQGEACLPPPGVSPPPSSPNSSRLEGPANPRPHKKKNHSKHHKKRHRRHKNGPHGGKSRNERRKHRSDRSGRYAEHEVSDRRAR